MKTMSEKRYCELRAQGRVLSGSAVRYGDVATLPFGRERFQAGASPGVATSDVILNASHDRGRPLARTGGGGLVLTDTAKELSIRADLAPTREADDTLTLVRAGVLRGISLEFIARSERREGNVRVIERADLRGLGVVDRPAYGGSLVSAREEVRQRGRGLTGRFDYNVPTVLRDRGRRRKQTVRPGAFRFAIEDETREINLLLGRNYDQPLASKQAGTLTLIDNAERLEFFVDELPDTSYVSDFRAGLSSGAFVAGIAALFTIPPASVVPEATELVPDPDNPDVDVEVISEAVLTALAVTSRPPRGNPGEVSERAAEGDLVAGKQQRKHRVWL